VSTGNLPKVCDCNALGCPKCEPPTTLQIDQERSIQYWARHFGVTDKTIINWFGDDVKRRGGRLLLSRRSVENRFPDAIKVEALS
jgi:hypothetical protein